MARDLTQVDPELVVRDLTRVDLELVVQDLEILSFLDLIIQEVQVQKEIYVVA